MGNSGCLSLSKTPLFSTLTYTNCSLRLAQGTAQGTSGVSEPVEDTIVFLKNVPNLWILIIN